MRWFGKRAIACPWPRLICANIYWSVQIQRKGNPGACAPAPLAEIDLRAIDSLSGSELVPNINLIISRRGFVPKINLVAL
jgi:hypothetical protein